MERITTRFTCPICGHKLIFEPSERRYICDGMHSFDRARSGYVNLLISQKGGDHGDNREMTLARKKFLDGGYYEPLRLALCDDIKAKLSDGAAILDSGCGEGYYTEGIMKTLPHADVYGIDISKSALSLIGQREHRPTSAVASVYHLPFGAEEFDAATSVFSPFAREEFLRVLKPHGMIFSVIPSRRHLFGLKSAIYDTPYENEIAPYEIDGFEFIRKREISYTLTLDSSEKIDALFKMTPYCYRTSSVGRERVAALDRLETEIGFEILMYKKK